MNISNEKPKIAVIGLGYVGLPLAVEFSKQFETIGFDKDEQRILDLSQGIDRTHEMNSDELKKNNFLTFTTDLKKIANSSVYIVTVPTPIDSDKKPDFKYMVQASINVGSILKNKDLVIYESTVYPGAIEEICIPILEERSGKKLNQDFFVGYSPERINPGDKKHRLTEITKITSGSNQETAEFVDQLYASIIKSGTHKVSSIKIAEAAKVIENTQRDLNIALMNEFSIIFNKLEIDTSEVFEAAKTKWNFLPFEPGLVGGHCISIDPYYLTYKAEEIGYRPVIILSGRQLNDAMGDYVAATLIKEMESRSISIKTSKILIMGFTFKENCPDFRNTKVIDIKNYLSSKGAYIDVYDPWVDEESLKSHYTINLIKKITPNTYDAIIVAVKHDVFSDMGVDKIKSFGNKNLIIFDVKSIFPSNKIDLKL